MLSYRDSRLGMFALAAFFLVLLGYAYYEGRAVLYGPRIMVPSSVVHATEPLADIQGQALHIVELRMNGEPISITEEGVFDEQYVLAPGENRIVLDATDRYGRTEQEIIEILYTPRETPRPATTEPIATSTATSTPTSTEAF